MTDLNIIITPSAEADMQDIFDYIALNNTEKAIKMIDIFENKFELLAKFPKSGSRKSYFVKRDIREFVVAKHYQII